MPVHRPRAATLAAAIAALAFAFAFAAPANATTVAVDESTLTVSDPAGQADDLRLGVLEDGTTFTVAGPTALAGTGCRQEAGLVLCPTQFATAVEVYLGAGDDRLVVDTTHLREESPETRVEGGAGADAIEAHGLVLGGDGDDVLRINQPSDEGDELDGEAGNDQLFAGARAGTLVGGPGTDALHGGPGNDSLVDTTDRGSHDTIACGGGRNQVERDAGDRLVGCSGHRVSVLALIKYFWNVYPGGYTVPVTLRLTPLPGTAKLDEMTQDIGSWTAGCRGKACHGARFSEKRLRGAHPRISFRLRGGVRVPGKRTRSVRAGAKLYITYHGGVAGYFFDKELVFTTRAGKKLPVKKRTCFASRIIVPQLGSGSEGIVETGQTPRRRVPCH